MYDSKSAGADAYRELADEVLRQDGFDVENVIKEGSANQSSKRESGNKESDKKKGRGFFGRRKED
jgi:chromosome partitioning protein